MSPWRSLARRAPFGRQGFVLAALIGAVLAFGTSLFLLFQEEQQSSVARENDVRQGGWVAFQAQREQLRLMERARALVAGDAAPEDVRLQLDLLVSRIDLLMLSSEARAVASEARVAPIVEAARGGLAGIEPALLALREGDRAGLAALAPAMAEIEEQLRALAQDVALGRSDLRGSAEARSFAIAFRVKLACMLLAVAVIVALLLRELRARAEFVRRARQAEQDAVQERERLVDAIEAADDAFALFDAADRLVLFNSKYLAAYPSFADKLTPGARFADTLRYALANGYVEEAVGREDAWFEARMAQHRAPGEPAIQRLTSGGWVRITERRTRDGGVVSVRTDITALKRREAELAELARANDLARTQLLEAVEAFPGSFVMFDAEERLVLWNSKRETFFSDEQGLLRKGMTSEELLWAGLAAGRHPEVTDRAKWVAEMMAWHRSPGRPLEVEPTPGRWIRLQNHRSSTGGVVSVGIDVTDAKLRERQLAQAQRMEAVGQLTGGIAHDFNNLLLVVTGNADWLLENVPEAAPMRKMLEAIRSAGERGAALVRQLLAFSRNQRLAPERVDLGERMGAVAQLLRRTLGEQIRIAAEPCPRLPAVEVDPAQLDTALINLAINARDAMPQGGTITLAAAPAVLNRAQAERLDLPPGRYVRLTVADDGEGMPPPVAERAFEPFFTTKEVGKGTGLGLSMVYGLLRQSRGSAEISSAPGAGTTVSLYLPAAAGEVAPLERAPAAAAPAPRGAESVLVAEDNADVRDMVSGMLSALGYRVLEAEDGARALALLESDAEIQLLLTDLVMPGGIGGRELARRALALRPGLPVLFTSGYSSDEPNAAASANLLRKPYRRAELAERVREALRSVGETAPAARAQIA